MVIQKTPTKIDKIVSLRIGQHQENVATQIKMDVSDWITVHPTAGFHILFKRPGEVQAQPVLSSLEEGILTWTVQAWETSLIGVGYAEVRAIEAESALVAKSRVIPCSIEESVAEDGEVPPEYSGWVERVLEVADLADDLEQSIADGIEDIQAKGTEVLDSIPADYTTLSDDVTDLKSQIGDLDNLTTTAKSNIVAAINEAAQSGGGGGTSNYNDLSNKPQIGGVTLSGNKSLNDLGIHNVPAGGSSGQVLSKVSGTDYDLAWVTQSGGGSVDLSYVTPEKYGAVGDGVTDDTTAVQAALDYGRTNKVSVRGYKRYKTSSPLTISGTYCDVFLNVISYSGIECGLIVKGSYHTIRLEQLYCSNGGAVVYKADTGNISWINFQANRVFAKGHAVDFQTSNDRWILYNTFNIRAIKSDTGNCYNGADHVGENTFYNSACTCSAGWAIYRCSGRFYNFSLESDVLNGIYATPGSIYVGFRHREMTDKLIYRINGTQPDSQGGTLIKFVGSYRSPVKYISEDVVPYEAVDVSEMDTLGDIMTASPLDISLVTSLTRICVIDAPIRFGDWTTQNGNFVLGKQMLVAGGRKICVPAFETKYTIIDSDFDMRDTQVALNNAKPYPTKMIIGIDNCVIHLPTSYCPYGYSEFIVDQTNHTCTIYDSNSDVTPIFNGSLLGTGVYRLKTYCDTLDNAATNYRSDYVMNINDTVNYIWEIEKIDENGSGSANVGIINVADYGAVGDGITDDSQAIQNAVDAGYDIYFESNKTYYIPTTVTIDHDIYIHGGENTVIRTETNNGTLNNVFVATGTLKKTTTLTTDYTTKGNTANSGNRFTLSDMTGISIGDIMIITATDQYYNYSRAYYYLGATLLIGDIYDGHLYATDAMPWDIENTQNVSVQIYSAPTVKIENLHFVADMNSHGNYRYFIYMSKCKNSEIKNCDFTQFDSGVCLEMCVNTHVDGIQMSKSEEVEITGDGYSLLILSCSNTIVERMMAICSQAGISLSGTIPNINTYVRNCDLASECRRHGVAMHENSYNSIIEDCVLGGLNLLGTGVVNRCRFVNNNRTSSDGGITFCGSHNPDYAIIQINDCVFESANGLYVYNSSPQEPIQAYDNIIGLIEINRCKGGRITYQSRASEYTLSNTIKMLKISNWENCNDIYHPNSDDIIEKMIISNSTFVQRYWINDHTDNFVTDGLYDMDYSMTMPLEHKITVNKPTCGDVYVLPSNVPISVSSENISAKFVVCGKNLSPNNPEDYYIGAISGNAGDNPSRTIGTGTVPTLSNDSNGNIVFTQKNNTSTYSMYPIGLFYMRDNGNIVMSAKIKNTGATSPATFRPCIYRINSKTKLVTGRHLGTAVDATSGGATISYSYAALKDEVCMCYYLCSSPVANAETTFEDMVSYVEDIVAPTIVTSEMKYEANRRIGDGTIMSLSGVNNIMCSELDFHISIAADYVNNPVGLLPDGAGVSF